MARAHGREAVFTLNGQDISNDVTNLQVQQQTDTAEVSAFGDAKKSYILGLTDQPVTGNVLFNDSANRAHGVLSALVGGTAGYAVKFQPKGTATGEPVLNGTVLLSEYNMTAPIGGAVTMTFKLVPFNSTGLVWSTN